MKGVIMIYCPRCGSKADTLTKFCKGCGLALHNLSFYLATEGEGVLLPSALNLLKKAPKLLRILLIALLIFFIPLLFPLLIELGSDFDNHVMSLVRRFRGFLPFSFIFAFYYLYIQLFRSKSALLLASHDKHTNLPPYSPSVGSITEDETQSLSKQTQTPKHPEVTVQIECDNNTSLDKVSLR
jgi:hypothetical protein